MKNFIKYTIITFIFYNYSLASYSKEIKSARLECEIKPEMRKEQIEAQNIKNPKDITEEMILQRKKEIEEEAIKMGISPETAELAQTLIFITPVAISEVKQPEKILFFNEYFARTMPASKILDAKKFLIDYLEELEQIEKQYKVEKEIIVTLMLIETYFGKVLGKSNIMDSLFTLSLTSHRPNFWKSELLIALELTDRKNTIYNRETKGSWAGAVGLVQFIPSSFKKLAVDGDGDGIVDTINSKMDAFASAANYLKSAGWKYQEPYMREVFLNLTQEELCNKAGTNFEDGVLVFPDKKLDTRHFIVYNNFAVILLWNKSLFFATTAGLVYNELKNVKK